MPSVSPEQHRAMEAAAHGRSSLGIPKNVGKEFVAADGARHAAGVVFVAPDGDVLLLRRSRLEKNYAGHWALPGGGAEPGETPERAADREVMEEVGYDSTGGVKRLLDRRATPNGMVYSTFAQPVGDKFQPKLNEEHSGFAWAGPGDLPEPLHPAVKSILSAGLGAANDMAPDDWAALRAGFARWTREEEKEPEHAAMDSAALWQLAMDRAEPFAFSDENRTKDRDGRLRVKNSVISKANVCPYAGKEIPRWREMGLSPNRIYYLLRDPTELKKAAPTFDGVPLLIRHKPTSAAAHPTDLVAGAIGTGVRFENDRLIAPLSVWTAEGVDGVEGRTQKELSSGYNYRADMTPGTYRGTRYDGVMRDIHGNHVALVVDGRAGDDVMVGDATGGMDAEQSRAANGQFGTGSGLSAKQHEDAHIRHWNKAGDHQTKSLQHEIKGNLVASSAHQAAMRSHSDASKKHGEAMKNPTAENKEAATKASTHAHASTDRAVAAKQAPKSKNAGMAGDSTEELTRMSKKTLSRLAAASKIAILTYLRPSLAMDAKIDFGDALKGVTSKTWRVDKAKIAAAAKASGLRLKSSNKLAQDADLEGLVALLDSLDNEEGLDEEEEGMDDEDAMDEEGLTKSEREAYDAMCDKMTAAKDAKAAKDKAARDAAGQPPEFPGRPDSQKANDRAKDGEMPAAFKKKDDDAKPVGDKAKDEKPVTEQGMDAALRRVRKEAKADMMGELCAIQEAEKVCKPLLGSVEVAMDSADAVYDAALEAAGEDAAGLNTAGKRRLVEVLVRQREEVKVGRRNMAMDSSRSSGGFDIRKWEESVGIAHRDIVVEHGNGRR